MPRRVETAIGEKERELKDSLLSVEENVPGSGSPKIPKIQIQWIVDIKKSTNMLAMLVGKPNGFGIATWTHRHLPGASTRTCCAEGTGQSSCRNGGRGEVAGGVWEVISLGISGQVDK